MAGRKRYNLGIIGAGMYGKILIRFLRQDARANIVFRILEDQEPRA